MKFLILLAQQKPPENTKNNLYKYTLGLFATPVSG